MQRWRCSRGHPQGVPLRGVAARAGVSATLEVLTRAPTRGAPTGGGREGGVSAMLEVLTRAPTRGAPTGGGREGGDVCNVGGVHEG